MEDEEEDAVSSVGVAVEHNRRLDDDEDSELILLVRKEKFFGVKRLYCCLGV